MRRPKIRKAAARYDQSAGETRFRPLRLYGHDRGGGRPRHVRHVLLPVLCPRDSGSQRVEKTRDQQHQARQHPWGLRLRADACLNGAMRRGRRKRQARMKEFIARHAIGKPVSGEALVANDGFSARYDLDRIGGTFSRPTHKLAGQSYVGKILVLDTAKGGVASAWMLRGMASRGIIPLALVFNSVNPILAQGAAFGDVPMLAGFDLDITRAVPNGALVAIDPAARTITTVEQKP